MAINNTWSSLCFREPLERHEKISAQKYVLIYNHSISNTIGLLLLIRGEKSNSCLGNPLDVWIIDLIATRCLDPTTSLMFANTLRDFTLLFFFLLLRKKLFTLF